MKKQMLSTLLAVAACGLVQMAQAGVKYVAHGWDLLAVSPEEVLANAEAFDKTAVDGVTLMVDTTLPDGRRISHAAIMNDPPWPRELLKDKIAVFREIVKHPSLKESFISSWWQPRKKRLAWTDDAAWANFAANMGTVAWLAKQGGLRGVLVDGEDYPKARQYDRLPGDPDYDTCVRLARQRGAEVFGAIFKEFPDVTFLSFWLISITPEYFTAVDPLGRARARGDLWPAFLNGMLDVLPPTARFVDGNEHAYRYNAEKNDFYASACRQRKKALGLIAPENRAKWHNQLQAGFGLYLDAYVTGTNSAWYLPPLNGSRLSRYFANLEQATDAADAYVWIYGERHPWVAWKNTRSKRFVGKPTWEDALPGFTVGMEGVKDSLGYLKRHFGPDTAATNLLRNGACVAPKGITGAAGYQAGKVPASYGTWQEEGKKFRKGTFGVDTSLGVGDTSSLCAEGVEKGCFLASLENVKPGETYAVVASGRGARVSGSVYWQKNNKWQWQLTGCALSFDAGAPDAWRRGYALVRVPEGADKLVLQLGLSLDPGERIHYDAVAVYKAE